MLTLSKSYRFGQNCDRLTAEQSTHYIGRTKHDTIPGKPDEFFFVPELSGGQNQGTNISDSEIHSTYSQEENLMKDATIVINDVDEEFVEYFEYVVHEENFLYLSTNWKGVWELFIHI